MTHLIVIAGAPGSGKSTIAALLQTKLDSPMFEFGWIPEFRNTGDRRTSYEEDEGIAFENLSLVTHNYIKHGYRNIIITDLENKRLADLSETYKDIDYKLFTLRVNSDDILKTRVLDDTRSSGYRDWQEAIEINNHLLSRKELDNEIFIDISEESPDTIVEKILPSII